MGCRTREPTASISEQRSPAGSLYFPSVDTNRRGPGRNFGRMVDRSTLRDVQTLRRVDLAIDSFATLVCLTANYGDGSEPG
jgi:hypothetical protein